MKTHKDYTKRKNSKTEVITIRATKSEKRQLKERARKRGEKLSEYLINTGLNKQKCTENMDRILIQNIVQLQELCNYIEDTYGEDSWLNVRSDKIWNSLQLKC